MKPTKEMIDAFILASSTAGGGTEDCVSAGLTAALAAMPAEPQADDWSVDDTICAQTILNYLGIGDDPSLDQYADRRRAKVAAFIADRVQSAIAAVPAVDEVRTLSGETVFGIPVAAYMEHTEFGSKFATHWSTIPKHKNPVRLFSEHDVSTILSAAAEAMHREGEDVALSSDEVKLLIPLLKAKITEDQSKHLNGKLWGHEIVNMALIQRLVAKISAALERKP